MFKTTHSVLGTDYEILLGTREEISLSEENMGECRPYSKKILVSTEQEDCDEEELMRRTQEIVAHELFHAYLNEAGIQLEERDEELLCDFMMKSWRKYNNSVLSVLEESGFLDN